MPLYIITKAHYSGDHCHLVGVFNDKEIARKVFNESFSKLKKLNDIEEYLLKMHTVNDDKINTQLYDFKCDFQDYDEEEEED